MERTRESYWSAYPKTSPIKLLWRALTVRHCFHVLPGESILEVGAGTGLWTEKLAGVFNGENPITAAVFNEDFLPLARKKNLPGTNFVTLQDLKSDLPAASFDYVVGTAILCHTLYSENLSVLYRLLKPGGQLLFFEANYWNPQVFVKTMVPTVGRLAGNARCQVGMRKYDLMREASHQGFTHVQVIPYDIIHALTPRFLIKWLRAIAFILEHTPFVREFCGTLYIWAKKPGDEQARRPEVSLDFHPQLFDSVSVVVPCHNEEMNVRPLVNALLNTYDRYIHEILLVNDNSRDGTASAIRALSAEHPRVKLIDRKPPNGVGRALRDGYTAASGRYILTMDCDFVQIIPEFRDLFAAVAAGYDGAIGSRFSHESVLINYPLPKILANRGFHLLLNLLLRLRVRDISNNLKLMRSDVLKTIDLEEHHFAANVETGLKPIVAGYAIKEVPISWINRTAEMGTSSFKLLRLGPQYAMALFRIVWKAWRSRSANRNRATLIPRKSPVLIKGPEAAQTNF
jgi:dolichol-phosphate mannosyltransferase